MATAEIRPGMVGLRNKKTGDISYHFPVDIESINRCNPGVFELAADGSIEASRLAMTPLRQAMASNPEVTAMKVAGIEGSVVTAATAKEADKIVAESVADDGKPKGNSGAEKPAAPAAEKK